MSLPAQRLVNDMTTHYFSFDLKDNAEKFVGAILDHGARPNDVSIIVRETGATFSGEEIKQTAATGISTTTAVDFEKGAIAGTGIGFSLGIAAGLASLFVPGVGLVLGGGTLATAIAGAAATTAGGALAGGIAGYLRDMGVGGEVPDEFDRDFAEDYVIVGVASDANGIDGLTLEQMADKYHAARTTFAKPTAAVVSVASEQVRTEGKDPLTGEDVEVLETSIPQGVDAVETVPVAPVVPIPGTKTVVPTAAIDTPEVTAEAPERSKLKSAYVAGGAGRIETTIEREAAGHAKAEQVRVQPVVRTTPLEVLQAAEAQDPVEDAPTVFASRQPAEAVRGDAKVIKTTVEEPPVTEKIETTTQGRAAKRIESTRSLEQKGTERIERVVVDPRTRTAERKVVERPVDRRAEAIDKVETRIEPKERS